MAPSGYDYLAEALRIMYPEFTTSERGGSYNKFGCLLKIDRQPRTITNFRAKSVRGCAQSTTPDKQ